VSRGNLGTTETNASRFNANKAEAPKAEANTSDAVSFAEAFTTLVKETDDAGEKVQATPVNIALTILGSYGSSPARNGEATIPGQVLDDWPDPEDAPVSPNFSLGTRITA
jgi:hypothetical protein